MHASCSPSTPAIPWTGSSASTNREGPWVQARAKAAAAATEARPLALLPDTKRTRRSHRASAKRAASCVWSCRKAPCAACAAALLAIMALHPNEVIATWLLQLTDSVFDRGIGLLLVLSGLAIVVAHRVWATEKCNSIQSLLARRDQVSKAHVLCVPGVPGVHIHTCNTTHVTMYRKRKRGLLQLAVPQPQSTLTTRCKVEKAGGFWRSTPAL